MSFVNRSKIDERNAKAQLAESYNELFAKFSTYNTLEEIGNYQIIRKIGEGSFGNVFLATHKFLHARVVLKQGKKDDPNVMREVYYQRQFKHPNVTKLYEVIVTENYIYMVLEYCSEGELYDHLIKAKRLAVPKIKKIFGQICGAVYYLHRLNLCHRDLKLENILLDKRRHVKLSDFGFTRELPTKKDLKNLISMVGGQQNGMLDTICGTAIYMAPELIQRSPYSGTQVDIWALGVILYTMTYGAMPFDEDDEIKTKYKIINEEPFYKDDVPNDLIDLMKLLLTKNIEVRPQSLYAVLQHPFFKPYGLRQMEIVENLLTKQIKPFHSKMEKNILKKLTRLHFDTKELMRSVVEQKCDPFTAMWELMLEKERKKELQKRKKISRSRSVLRLSQAIASSPKTHSRKGSIGTHALTMILSSSMMDGLEQQRDGSESQNQYIQQQHLEDHHTSGEGTTTGQTLETRTLNNESTGSPSKSTHSTTRVNTANSSQSPAATELRKQKSLSAQSVDTSIGSGGTTAKKYNFIKKLGKMWPKTHNKKHDPLDDLTMENLRINGVASSAGASGGAVAVDERKYRDNNKEMDNHNVGQVSSHSAPATAIPFSGEEPVASMDSPSRQQDPLLSQVLRSPRNSITMRRSASSNSGRPIRPASMISTYSSYSQLTTMSETSAGSDNNTSYSTENMANYSTNNNNAQYAAHRPQYDRARSSEFSAYSRLSKNNDASSTSSTTNISRTTSIDSNKSGSIKNRGRPKNMKKNAGGFFMKRGKSPIGYSNRFMINKRKMGLMNNDKKAKAAVIQEEYESSISNSSMSIKDRLADEDEGVDEDIEDMEDIEGMTLPAPTSMASVAEEIPSKIDQTPNEEHDDPLLQSFISS